jgi:hypothetical protein
MRLNWMLPSGHMPTIDDVQTACGNFFQQNKVIPDTIKMTYHDMSNFMRMMPFRVEVLEKGKEYGHFLPIPGGMVELLVLEEGDETVVTYNGGSMFVVESSQIDREFEKHVLKS